MSALVTRFRRLLGQAPRISSGVGSGLLFDAGKGPDLFIAGDYERPVQEAVMSLVHAGDVFFDIGANSGFFSVLAGRAVGANGGVYAFEPVSGNAALIERNAQLNGLQHVEVLRLACSDEIGRRELLLTRHGGGATLKGAGMPGDLVGRCIVDVSTIDALVADERIRLPDLVKIDVEGAELRVLRGMRKVLAGYSPVLIIEIDDETEEGCDRKLAECAAYLQTFGFEISALPDSYPNIRWFVRHVVARKARRSA